MGKAVGSQGHLYLFEPYSIAHSITAKNMELNNLTKQTTLYKIAASDRDSRATLNLKYENTGAGVIKQTN